MFSGCDEIQDLSDKVFKPSARKIYARDFRDDDSIYKTWEYAFTKARQSKLQLSDPVSMAAKVESLSNSAYGYRMSLQQGEQLVVEISSETDHQFFIDFFQIIDDRVQEDNSFSAKIGQRIFTIDIQETGTFQIVIQPEISFQEQFSFRVYTQPTYSFPVAGVSNSAIKSFWGASRDGGKRSHEGVDVFADRGTPVISSTSGFVGRTGNYGLGGKQVWIKDGLFGHSLYYAHLDSIIANRMDRVQPGDTLGLVGNTGNARTTPPHLHFGIYTNKGAVNPYPFIKERDIPKYYIQSFFTKGQTTSSVNLREEATTDSEILQQLQGETALQILASNGNWFQVITENQLEGFVYASLISTN